MYFDKKSCIVDIKGGQGTINTGSIRGMVVHLIVRPESKDTIWDLTILDKDGDELVEIEEYEGRLDDKSGLPLGADVQEIVTISFTNVSKNEPIKVIFKTKEYE